MIYNPNVASISREEFDELMAIVRAPVEEPKPRTPEAQWRADYRAMMNRGRVLVQPDLFGEAPAVQYLRHAPAPAFDVPPPETVEAKLERIKGDPFATFGPGGKRALYLTEEEKDEIAASAKNWMFVGQRVRITGGMRTVDGRGERKFGRVGVIWRRCSTVFRDHVYVYLDPVGAERSEKIVFLEIRDIEPIE